MANEQRGEFEIRLAGIPYGMRPTYDAIQAFEGTGGLQLSQMAVEASRGGLSVRVCSVIIAECVRAWGKAEGQTAARAFQADAVGPLLVSSGIDEAQEVLADMLVLAVTGGLDAEGKRKAAPKKPKAPISGVSAVSPAPRSAGSRKTSTPRPRSSSTKR